MNRSKLTRLLFILAVVLLCQTIQIQAAPSAQGTKHAKGMIVFFSDKDGDSEVYVMNPDGSGLSAITNNDYPDQLPIWSPDGKRIAFMAVVEDHGDMFVMNADGTQRIRLTSFPSLEAHFSWSPDSTHIVFSKNVIDEDVADLYVMEVDDGREMFRDTLMEQLTEDSAINIYPSWSPDGEKIVFTSTRDGNAQIYVMDADGDNVEQLTEGRNSFMASWSPDGKQIAFTRIAGEGTQIYVMDADGDNATQVTDLEFSALYPSWSPDGKQLVFMAEVEGERDEVWVVNVDGSDAKRISPKGMNARYPNWSSVQPPLKLPLSKLKLVACPKTTDKTYGYTLSNPITVGSGDFMVAAANEYAYFDSIRGPKGEVLEVERIGTDHNPENGVIVDIYDVTYKGLKKPIQLYIDMYSQDPPQVPVGFTCSKGFKPKS